MEMSNTVCTRRSLGRYAKIGELYNIRNETFKSRPLFNSSLPQKHVTTIDIANTDFNFEFTENLSDKMDLLKVDAELQLSVLFKLIKVQGSCEFLTEEKKSDKVISCSLVCQIRTQQDKLFAPFKEILPHVDTSALQSSEYTHYVSEITWGTSCLLTLDVAYKEDEQKKGIKGALMGGMSKIKKLVDVEAGGGLTKNSSAFFSCENMKIKVHADIVPEYNLPTSVEGFLEFLEVLPKLLKNVNGGKGTPLSYVLTPLEEIRQLAQVEYSFDVEVRKIDEGFVTSTVILFDNIRTIKQRLNDLKTELTENQNYVKSEDINKATDMLNALSIKKSNLQELILDFWAEVRSGRKELRHLIKAVENSKNNDLNLHEYEKYLRDCSPILKKLSTIKMYTSLNVVYLGKEDTFVNLQLSHPSSEFIVLITCSEFEKIDSELCTNTTLYFRSLVEQQQQNTIYVVVDLDLVGVNSFEDSRARCFHLSGNKIVNKDLYATYLLEMLSNFARAKPQSFKLCRHKPGNRVLLEIPCPGFELGTCPPTPCVWTCHTCKDNIEYGFNDNFYCICGVCPINAFMFRCKEPKHGNLFCTPTEEFLADALKSLHPLKEMNILILGQTGVGKSTWINSIVNYLTYDTMQTAKEQGVICTIPVRYGFHNPVTRERTDVIIGEKRFGEEVEYGSSDTQSAHTYSFQWEGKCVRIIDTPGIGDTRGLPKDKENMKSIFEHLAYLKELHGLCILLKASDSKSTTYFNYCIKELLVHLPKSIVNNIVFCFTNSRSALYTSGPSSVILSSLIEQIGLQDKLSLGEHNMFTLDNEAFVFLCSLTNPDFQYPPKVLKSYADSWEMAAEESVRLFNTVKTFEPRLMHEMISLVEIRERILTLTIPLAEIGKTIQMNLTDLEKWEKELQESSMTIREWQEKLYVEETFLMMEDLRYPRTVCTSEGCISVVGYDTGKQVEYNTVCHDECYLPHVEPKIVNNHALKECDAMFAGSCMNCGCGWENHMHLTYTQKRIKKKVKSDTVKEKIEKEEMENKKKEQFISELKEKTEKYKEEQEFIIKVSGILGVFLKKHAITVYNDSVKDYLQHIIDEQQKISDRNEKEEKVLEGLKKILEQYNYEVEMLQNLTQVQTTENFSIQEMKELEESLYNLELTGEQIKNCVQVSRNCTARLQEYRETPIQVRKSINTRGPGLLRKVKNCITGVSSLFN